MPFDRRSETVKYYPQGGHAEDEADPLSRVIGAAPSQPFVIAQLGQSLDGRIATVSGDSRYINSAAALDHLHRLRAHVDAVVVGIGTVIADDPLLTVRRVEGRSPARVVVDPNGRLPKNPKCFHNDGTRRMVIRSSPAPTPDGVEQIVAAQANGMMSPRAIVDALFARGLRRLLIEGGARTISSFVQARAVDRLHVLVSPMILGSGRAALELDPIGSLREALRPRTDVHVFADGDVLFDCDLRSSEER